MSTTTVTASSRTNPAGKQHAGKVTQAGVLKSEWIKLRSLRSTFWTFAAAIGFIIGLGLLISFVTANHWPNMDPRERIGFDPTGRSLGGAFLAQLAVGVLGVLIISGEYATGMIRASLGAVPKRLPVLWGKILVFAAVTLVLMEAASFIAFFAGQAVMSSQHIGTTLSAQGVLRAVIGTGLYLTGIGILGVALGALLRNTAGAIATLFGLLLVLPVLVHVLPDNWRTDINPYLPSNAGQVIANVHSDPGSLGPWAGFGVFCIYIVVAVGGAAVLLKRRDA